MSDAEWALVAPLIPPAKRGGRPREVDVREVLNAMFYVLSTGCQWEALPKDLPPRSTAHHYFMLWDWDGTLVRIHDALYVAVREAAEARPARRRRSSTARASRHQKGGFGGSAGLRRGQEGNGRKRTSSSTRSACRSAWSIPPTSRIATARATFCTRSVGAFRFERMASPMPAIRADNASNVAATGGWQLEIVKRPDRHRFVVLPNRWIVERTFAWISRNRRLMRDFERHAATVAAFVRLAMIRLMLKRLTRPSPCS